MKNKLVPITFIFLVHSFLATAQVIDNTALYRNMVSDKSIRLHYENDFFSGSDLYHTQGINLEIIHPKLRYFLLSKLLLNLPEPAMEPFRQRQAGLPTCLTKAAALSAEVSHVGRVPIAIGSFQLLNFQHLPIRGDNFIAAIFLSILVRYVNDCPMLIRYS